MPDDVKSFSRRAFRADLRALRETLSWQTGRRLKNRPGTTTNASQRAGHHSDSASLMRREIQTRRKLTRPRARAEYYSNMKLQVAQAGCASRCVIRR